MSSHNQLSGGIMSVPNLNSFNTSQIRGNGGGGGGGGGSSSTLDHDTNSEGLIVNPRDADVLCGRGGAALRHPGNQTYRRLVTLNKGLYITCLKTEKLKISRSIVTAIRDQDGRFLEKDAKSNAWYDIGDKKAVEKTSQALREGQPKLRLIIAELGSVAMNQYEGGEQGTGGSAEFDSATFDANPNPQLFMQRSTQQQPDMLSPHTQNQMQQQQQQRHQLMHQGSFERHISDSQSNLSAGTGGMQSIQSAMRQQTPHSPHNSAHNLSHDLHADMLHRLSLQDMQTVASATGDMNLQHQLQHQHHPMASGRGLASQFQQQQQIQLQTNQQQSQAQQYMNQQRPPMQQQQQLLQQQQLHDQHSSNLLRSGLSTRAALAQEFGITESQLSLMSEVSGFGGSILGLGSTHTLGSHMTSSRSTLTASNPHISSNTSNPHMMNLSNRHMSNTSNPHMLNSAQSSSNPIAMTASMNSMMTNSNHQSQIMTSMNRQMAGLSNLSITNSVGQSMPSTMHQNSSNLSNPMMSCHNHNPHATMSNNIHMVTSGLIEPNMGCDGLSNHGVDIQNMMASDPSFRNALLALPTECEAEPTRASTTGSISNYGNTIQNNLKKLPATRTSTGEVNNNNSNDASNFDRRHIFAKMKFNRPPSVRSPGGNQSSSQEKQSQHGFDEASNFHMVDSSNSLISNFSHMTPTDQKANVSNVAASSTVTAAPVASSGTIDTGNFKNMHAHGSQGNKDFAEADAVKIAKVHVETGKVVDHSSGSNYRREHFNSDAMSTGSRNSMMSGLSRISDTSLDNSIFSDLSKKIGNVSTRSMAMSEMSAIELQELDEEDHSDTEAADGPIVTFDIEQQRQSDGF